MSLKKQINKVLKATGYRYFYMDGDNTTFPFIRYSHGNTLPRRYSGKTHDRYIWYQIDVFDARPHDVEDSDMLLTIQKALEEDGLQVTEWKENQDTVNETRHVVYQYYMEVRALNSVER